MFEFTCQYDLKIKKYDYLVTVRVTYDQSGEFPVIVICFLHQNHRYKSIATENAQDAGHTTHTLSEISSPPRIKPAVHEHECKAPYHDLNHQTMGRALEANYIPPANFYSVQIFFLTDLIKFQV